MLKYQQLLSTQIHLTLVTSVSKITHLVAFLNIALGHFGIKYNARRHVVTLHWYTKNHSITWFSKYPQVYFAQMVRKAAISPY